MPFIKHKKLAGLYRKYWPIVEGKWVYMYVSGGPSVLPFFADFRAPPPQKKTWLQVSYLAYESSNFSPILYVHFNLSGKDHFRPEICQVKTSGKVYEIKSSQVYNLTENYRCLVF